jgi:hypothetical protein
MSYQTIPEYRDEETSPRGRRLLFALGLVCVAVVAVVVYRFEPLGRTQSSDPAVDEQQIDELSGKVDGPAGAPSIDMDALSSTATLPGAPSMQLQEADVSVAESAKSLRDDPEYVTTFLSRLQVSALSSTKAVINGEVYHFGEYVDPVNIVKFQGIRGGILYFEAGGKSYPYEPED